MDSIKEIWKPIKGFEEYYQISNLGKVKSLGRKVGKGCYGVNHKYSKPRLLSIGKNTWGYLGVMLTVKGKNKRLEIAKTVLEHFGTPKPQTNKRIEVNHKDGNKENNTITNLEWVTPRENHLHAVKLGLATQGVDRYNAVFTKEEVIKMRKLHKTGKYSQTKLARMFNKNYITTNVMLRGKSYKNIEEG